MTGTTIYLIGGTSDANQIAAGLESAGYRVVISVATEVGALLAGCETDAGRKDAAALAERARHYGAAALVDCSHPFALQVSDEAREAARQAELPYLRYQRPPLSGEPQGCRRVQSFAAAVDLLKERQERALLTIGSRNLAPFASAGLDVMARILPVADSVQECQRLGLGPRDILAVCPPFSVDFNRACIRLAAARVLVTKDSGREGGLIEKLEAAAVESIDVILVERPNDSSALAAVATLAELLKKLESLRLGR